MDTQEQVAAHICDFSSVQNSNYLRGELIRKTELKVREMERLQVRLRLLEK